jgi:hypothetical protein
MSEHDYTRRFWGHDYVFEPIDEGLRGKVMGWGNGITAGDYLILQNGNGDESTRYKVETIRYELDPSDMWSADVTFAPRSLKKEVK